MTRTIEAVYENGLFRPLVSVDLPEKSVIEIDLHLPEDKEEHLLTDAERLQRNPAEWIKQLREWANEPRDLPPSLPDEALRRENIYEDRC